MKTLILSLVVAALSGCVTSQHLVTGKARPAILPDQVQVRAAAPAGAEEIGIVSALAGGQSDSAMKTAVAALKKQAAGMGANIIVVLGSDTVTTASSGGLGYVASSGVFYSPGSTTRETKVQAKAFYVDANH